MGKPGGFLFCFCFVLFCFSLNKLTEGRKEEREGGREGCLDYYKSSYSASLKVSVCCYILQGELTNRRNYWRKLEYVNCKKPKMYNFSIYLFYKCSFSPHVRSSGEFKMKKQH